MRLERAERVFLECRDKQHRDYKKIQILNLSNNKIANEGIKNLAIFIANGKSHLQTLNLSLNLIEDDGAVTLLKAFVVLDDTSR